MGKGDYRGRRRGYRSLFWPIVLVGIGAIWLLSNVGIFTMQNIAIALQLWPVLLIIAGVDMIFGRRSPIVGAAIGVSTVVIFLVLMLLGPSMGFGADFERQTDTVTTERGDATRYAVNIDGGLDSINIQALTDNSNNLVDATVNYIGEFVYTEEGVSDKQIGLNVESPNFNFPFFSFGDDSTTWQIALNPDVPLALVVDGGVGSLDFNLRDFYLTDVQVDVGVGSLNVVLPPPRESYIVNIDGGVGEVNITLPPEAAVRVVATTGVGEANISNRLDRVRGNDDDDFISVDGIWETPNFNEAEQTITIEFDGGVGSLDVR